MLVVGGSYLRDSQRFEAAAEHAEGVVVENTRHLEGEDWIDYQVISFYTAEEQPIRFEAPANDVGEVGFFRHVSIGERVRVAYDPQNPQDARVDTAIGRLGGPFAFLFSGVVLLVVAALFAWRGTRWERRQP